MDFEPTLTECINHQEHMGSDLLRFGAVIFNINESSLYKWVHDRGKS